MIKKVKIGLANLQPNGGTYTWSTIFRKFCAENEICIGNENEKNDVYIAVANTTPLLKLLQIKNSGTKIICRADGIFFDYFNQMAKKENDCLVETLKISDFIIFQSNFSKQLISKIFDIKSKPSSIIYNGVNTDIFCPNGPKENKKTNKKIILSLAHFGPPKMSLHSMESFINISNEIIDDDRFEFWILGLMLGDYKTKIMPKNVTRCELNKWLDSYEVAKALRSADIIMHIRPNDACSNLILESMNVNTPIIGLNSGSTPELLAGSGLLCDCYDLNNFQPTISSISMAKQIIKMNENYQMYKNLITNRSQFFNSKRMCKEYLKIISMVLAME